MSYLDCYPLDAVPYNFFHGVDVILFKADLFAGRQEDDVFGGIRPQHANVPARRGA